VNGISLAVSNDNSVTPPFGFGITATSTGITYPDSIQSLKHLRLYTHQLSLATIKADANNQFFSATDPAYLNWYRFNIPVAGALPTTINSTTTDETAIYDTYPGHVLLTTYGYNSTNQVNTQRSPDGGTSKFWYDLLSRLVISQNAKQLTTNDYSYTTYDVLGRITEVGQKNYTGTSIGSPDYLADATISSFNAAGTNSQVTDTWYDAPVPTVSGNTNGIASLPGQSNLRKRVAASTYTETQGGPALRATYYNYDLDGNVKTLWQQIDGLYQNSTNTGLKRVDYEYDLVSGKVNFVRYQDSQPDAFYYSYNYDADNRLTQAYSGITAIVDTLTHSYLPLPMKKRDAAYYYYLHGPLRRMTIGNNNANVQGVDYAYTLQGWLKGVNSAYATAATDIGQDGADLTHTTARDAYGYSLGYYTGDYSPIGGAAYTAFNLKYTSATGDITGQSLYNGNISNTTLAIAQLDGTNVNGYTYRYYQLNRLKKMRRHPGITGTSWSRGSITQDYQKNATYDGNGNILTYGRNGAAPTAQTIDSLSYKYSRIASGKLNNNRLQYITDAIANSNYTGDLTNQTNTSNYRYDTIGNLIYDFQSGITGNDGINSITWSVYGKIQNIYKTTGTISYTYNPAGQRVSKTTAGLTTYYVRDAQGNELAVYDNAHTTVNWKEQQLYGSSRLGMWTPGINLSANNAIAVWDTIGGKQYELDNHLGNVLATVTDKRLQHTINTTSIDYYNSDVSTAQEYYPFGMLMPGRQYSSANYRYGFNGKENDNEVKGLGNEQDYGERIYDDRGSRFLSVDPLTTKYPELTPYQFASNRPIDGVDMDGREFFKRDNTNYHWDYQPVLKAPTVLGGVSNATNNTLALLWNGTLGGLLQLSQSTGNYIFFDGWKANTPNPINRTIDQTFDALHETSNTPIKKQIKDLGVSFTNWSTYETVPQLLIFHEFSKPAETPKSTFVEAPVTETLTKGVKIRPTGISDMEWGNALHYDRLAGGTGEGLPTQLALKYPETTFEFTGRGAKGADVKYISGKHPSKYPGSTWGAANDYGDFKTIKDSKFNGEVNSGKLPKNTEKLTYDPVTGKLQ
jgi:RHS repeat-associated protein